MNVENQICTLEQAKRLKELGVAQNSLFAHCVVMPDPTGEKYYVAPLYQSQDEHQLKAPIEVIASAFTVAELGVMLPQEMYSKQNKDLWSCESILINRWNNYKAYGDTEAIARAGLLIYLLENNLATAEEVNQRLQTA